MVWRLSTLGRAFLIHEFCGQNGDNQASPVGNGVAKKRAPMRVGIGVEVEPNPAEQDDGGHDAQRVAVEEGAFAILFHENSMMNVGARWPVHNCHLLIKVGSSGAHRQVNPPNADAESRLFCGV